MSDEMPEAEYEAPTADPTRLPVEPIPVVMFEGNLVTIMEGSIPMVNMEMEEGYPLGTHLKFEIELRVANVRYEEGKGTKRRGEYVRKHVFATESVRLTEAFLPGELETIPVGNLASSEGLLEDEEDEHPQIPVEDAPVAPEGAGETRNDLLSDAITRAAEEAGKSLPPVKELEPMPWENSITTMKSFSQNVAISADVLSRMYDDPAPF